MMINAPPAVRIRLNSVWTTGQKSKSQGLDALAEEETTIC